MTLAEFHDAVDGYHEKKEEYLEGVRLICFYAAAPHTKKIKKLTDILELDRDNKARKERWKKMKPIEVTRYAK